ncbi:T9SS C-terminal target domain-containing protein, partial [Fluviicola chungangensis]
MEYNNVRAMIHTAGNLWQVPGQNFSQYEIPKNSKIMCFFTSALWLGGTDVNGQLKLAALRYRQGQDYWTGPLSNTTAEIDPSECLKYDNHFTSSKDLVRQFDAWYNAGVLDQQNGTSLQSANFPNYKVPDFIKNWPAHGDVSKGQDYNLAPFFDRDNDGNYEWEEGDYPWYDITGTKDCKTDRRVSLYGDFNMWWVMNDKGNIHTESGGEPIGMEIRAQAFAFATNDEINNMTFYNYELINRGTQTLYDTYFGVFTDGALGDPYDDYVGCDVTRGLGYFYNGDAVDGDNQGFYGYGTNPPAAGVDFFEGPYQDNDSIDNAYGIGVGEALNGIGYGDGIVDNERYGMRRFLYYINSGGGANPNQTDPTNAADYYNFLRGRWKDNTPFYYGGNGHISDPTVNPNVTCDFMFPDDTDPLGWGTDGIPQPVWTEQTANNLPYDRRFLQSAGPFILKPGAVNNITVGMVWARSAGGDPFESVKSLRLADDKAQALFENCFRVLEGPHAPELTGQELKNELILYLSNSSASNNKHEDYVEFDPFIVTSLPNADKYYRFQGYMIYQLNKSNVSVSDLEDPTKARLVAQVDIKDGVKRLVNFEFDENLQASFPVEKVKGADLGIQHTFRVTEDLFSSGDRRLINFKRYYFMAISYAYNNFKTYDPADPIALDGQKKPFLGSRKAAIGEVKVLELIPHDPAPEAMGTMHLASYGITPRITRLDGIGNGGRELQLTTASENAIVANGFKGELEYDYNGGPINVKVVDPLNVVGGYFECKFRDYVGVSGTGTAASEYKGIDTASWVVYRYDSKGGNLLDSVTSDVTIQQGNEQVVPKWGVSIEITQEKYYFPSAVASSVYLYTDPLSSSISYTDSTKQWLDFVEDDGSLSPKNWLRTGTYNPDQATECDTWSGADYLNPCCFKDE